MRAQNVRSKTGVWRDWHHFSRSHVGITCYLPTRIGNIFRYHLQHDSHFVVFDLVLSLLIASQNCHAHVVEDRGPFEPLRKLYIFFGFFSFWVGGWAFSCHVLTKGYPATTENGWLDWMASCQGMASYQGLSYFQGVYRRKLTLTMDNQPWIWSR